MPPNAKGGKGYKKGKHSSADLESKMIACNPGENQMFGRVLKALGSRRFSVFCNDSKTRICKICGSMRKSDYVEKGSLVRMSVRNLSQSTAKEVQSCVEIGDIIMLIPSDAYGKLKKTEGVNPLLFLDLENQEGGAIKNRVALGEDCEDFFEHGSGSGSESEEGEGDSEDKVAKALKKKEVAKERTQLLAAKRQEKKGDDDDINIDDI